jgi:enoyl-CoA hydratase
MICLKIAAGAALGGASMLGALPNLAGAQDTAQQTDTPAITLHDVPFSSGA